MNEGLLVIDVRVLMFTAVLAGFVLAVALGVLALRAWPLSRRPAAISGETPSRPSAQTPAAQVRATSLKPNSRAAFSSTSMLVLMLILTLGSIGVVNGLWSSNLTLDATVQTGDINADWVQIITTDQQPNPPTIVCAKGDKPVVLTMEYTGDGDDATSHSQDLKKVSVSGDPNDADPVYIQASDGGSNIYFAGAVPLNGTFEIDATVAGLTKLKGSETFVYVFTADGATQLQEVRFHTSCSQDLFLGDQFGGVRLVGYVGTQTSTSGSTSAPTPAPSCEATIGGAGSDAEFGDQVAYVAITEAAPGFSCDIKASIKNTGSIPFNIIGINGVLDAPNDEGLSFDDLNGSEPGDCQLIDELGDSTAVRQVDPGEVGTVNCKVLVDMGAKTCTKWHDDSCKEWGYTGGAESGWTYYFAIEVCVAQWNESADFDTCKNPPSGTHEGPDEPVLPAPGPPA